MLAELIVKRCKSWNQEEKHVLVPIEDEPISHKLSSIEPSSLQFQNFGENDFPAPPPHPQEMVDLEPAEYIRVPVKLGPDKTYREVRNFRTFFIFKICREVNFYWISESQV